MINILLVWMSLPVMAQDVVNPSAILERIEPMVVAAAPSYDIFKKVALPKPPQAVYVKSRLSDDSGQPLINGNLWGSLQPPNSAIRRWVMGQIPDLDVSQVRMMPLSTIEKITRAAIVAHDNSLSFMTDEGLTTPHVFYLSREVCQALFSKYNFGAITVDSGVSKGGRRFQIQAMLVGNNKVQVIYNLDHFEFSNSQYPQYPFILRKIVTYTISAPGDLNVDGIQADVGIVHATIQDIQDARNGYLQVDTDYGQQFVKSGPISVISGQAQRGSR